MNTPDSKLVFIYTLEHGVDFPTFDKRYRKTHKKVYPIAVTGMPVEEQAEIQSKVTKVSEESKIHHPYIVKHDYEMIIYKDKDNTTRKTRCKDSQDCTAAKATAWQTYSRYQWLVFMQGRTDYENMLPMTIGVKNN